MSAQNNVTIEAQMLIRKPIAVVFEALVNPAITTRFWFTNSSGRLGPDQRVRWDWDMYGVGDDLTVKAFEPNQRILIEWAHDPTLVEFKFEAIDQDRTWVVIRNWRFSGTVDEVLPSAVDAKGGYTLVLAGLKAWLEHGIELNLVRDQFTA